MPTVAEGLARGYSAMGARCQAVIRKSGLFPAALLAGAALLCGAATTVHAAGPGLELRPIEDSAEERTTAWPSMLALFTITSSSAIVGFGVLRDRRRRPRRTPTLVMLPVSRDPDLTQELTQPPIGLMGAGFFPGVPEAELVLDRAGSPPESLRLGAGETFFGRESSNAVVIAGSQASRHHARIWVEGGQYWVEDLQSTNGTWVNRAMITRQILQSGDAIQVGEARFIFTILAPDTATPAPVSALE